MFKKLILACMALAAFALPATALATNDPQLTSGGVLIPPGTNIVGTNLGETVFTTTAGAALYTCTKATLTGVVTRNDSGFIEATITRKDVQGTSATSTDNNLPECTSSFGSSYLTFGNNFCIRSTPAVQEDEFQIGADPAGGKCSETNGNVHWSIGSTTAGTCTYESTGLIKGDYTTNGTQTSLTVRNTQEGSGAKLTSGGFLCPSSTMLKMTFGLETGNGSAVTIS